MPRYTTYSVFANPADLQTLTDRLNSPRSYSENYSDDGTNDLGLGPNTARDDASTYQGVDEKPEGPPSHRMLTLSVAPHEEDRFVAICEDVGVSFDTYHPTGADGSEHRRAIDFPQANGMDRLPEESNV